MNLSNLFQLLIKKKAKSKNSNWKRTILYHQGSAQCREATEANPSSSDSLRTGGMLMLSLVVYQS